MATYEIETPKGTFEIESDRDLSQEDLMKAANQFKGETGLPKPQNNASIYERWAYHALNIPAKIMELATKGAGKLYSALTPEPIERFEKAVIKKPFELAGKVGSYAGKKLSETTHPAINKAVVSMDEAISGYPRAQMDLKTLANIGLLFPYGRSGTLVKSMARQAPKLAEKEAVHPGLMQFGNKIQNVKTKILAKEAREGAKVENIGKYDLFGSPSENVAKAKQLIDQTSDELKQMIAKSSKNPKNRVSLSSALVKAKEQAVSHAKTPIEKQKIATEWNKINDEFVSAYGEGPININLVDAQHLKQYVGKKGDWLMNNGRMMGNPESDLQGRLHNTIYDVLKKELENKGGPGIKELNTKISELIPLERANAKRLLVESRKNPISLDDYIGGLAVAGSAASGNFLPALIATLNVASKSPKVAKTLYKYGKQGIPGGKYFTGVPRAIEAQEGMQLESQLNPRYEALRRRLSLQP